MFRIMPARKITPKTSHLGFWVRCEVRFNSVRRVCQDVVRERSKEMMQANASSIDGFIHRQKSFLNNRKSNGIRIFDRKKYARRNEKELQRGFFLFEWIQPLSPRKISWHIEGLHCGSTNHERRSGPSETRLTKRKVGKGHGLRRPPIQADFAGKPSLDDK